MPACMPARPDLYRPTTCRPACSPPPAPLQGAAKKTLSGAVSFLKELSHTASNLYHKRTDDEEEEAEYLKVPGWPASMPTRLPACM